MISFYMNGYPWYIEIVDPYDQRLVDRTDRLRVATTDPITGEVCLSANLRGDFLIRVLIHELGHCTMFSFGLLREIHRMVRPEYWVDAEEWICNFLADYGMGVFKIAFSVLGERAWRYIPYELERMMSYDSNPYY